MRNWTHTKNEHWADDGMASPYESIPDYEYLDILVDYLRPKRDMRYECNKSQVPNDPRMGPYERFIEKSREMMGSLITVGFLTHLGQVTDAQKIIFQSQTQDKAEELIGYAKTYWDEQPDWLKRKFPLADKLSNFPKDLLRWENGSSIVAIPNDPDKIRSHHPTRLLMDECAYMGEFRKNREIALHCCRGIIMLTSAGPGEAADFVMDAA